MTVTTPATSGVTYQPFHRHLADGLAPQQRMYAQLSEDAALVQSLSPWEIPGQLQTEPWAREVFSYNPGFADDEQRTDIEEAVAARTARAAQLTAGTSQFHLLTTSFPLRFRRKWPQLPAQIDRLIKAALEDRYRFGLIPEGIAARQPPYTSVCIYDRNLAEVETYSGMLFLADAPDVAANLRAFEEFARLALYGEAAVAELRRLRAELVGD
ncbi:Scr1 family TA system antitoxin-like transcriptional regulator [Catenulispora pinisilvae]|uniref:Scr1 family TA system antitoxin-like transcriptional regulator n=1 Tax=Catenulispora pinisilvae TaxID=2705253 RepID=UPI001891A5D6|nr:Scr1 family TA system antitoxin-like transcriptional regulator [Catenulispora pinisilvae]